MSLHSIIEHRANYYFLKLEEDYVEICQGKHKHCKAAILSILENWMNSKRATTSRESDLYVYLSYPQFVKQMFGLYGRNTVIASLEELEQEGLILKRPFRDIFNQVTFEYRLNCSVVQQELSKLSDKPATGGSLNLNGGSLEMDGGAFENKLGGSLKVNDPPFKSKRNIEPTIESDIEPTENTEREDVADATARSQPSSQKEVVDGQNQRHSGNPGNSSQPHLDTNGYSPLDASLTSQKDVAQNGHTHQHPVVDRDLPARSEQPLPRSDSNTARDTNKITAPPAPRKPPTNKTIPEPELTPDEQAVFDAWCSLFKVAVPLIPANAKASKQLVKPLQVWTGILDKSTAEVLKLIMNWAYKNDKNGYYKRGFKLYDAAREFEAWQSAQERPQGDKEESNEHKVTQPANAFIERCLDKDYNKRKLEEMRAKNALKRQAQAEGVQS